MNCKREIRQSLEQKKWKYMLYVMHIYKTIKTLSKYVNENDKI